MKFTQLVALGAGLLVSAVAFADPIVGKWKMSEDGKEKVVIQISENGGVFSAKIIEGLTDKGKKTVGKSVLKDVKSVGDGKYKGTGMHPTWGLTAKVDITVSGNKINIKSWKGTQTGVKQ